VGWDYGHTSGIDDVNKYVLAEPMLGGSYISITIAWDRVVVFENDSGTLNQYDIDDTFEPYTVTTPQADDVINDLDIYLLPKGATDFDNPIALSISSDSTIDHIFAEIPTTGEYEFWVHQWDNEATGDGQDCAIAWWAKSAINPAATGDYDGNGSVGPEDYGVWKSNFGANFAAADGNGDGTVNAADYTVWRNRLGQSVGSGSAATSPSPVPEPATWVLVFGGVFVVVWRPRW
jgi:hypothetical protein